MSKWEMEQIEHARNHFKDFRADFKDYGELQTLDWRNKSGSSNYYVHYIFDTKQGCMYVSGDLGSAVFCLTWEPTIANMRNAINQISYVTGKIECSTDKYYWPTEYVESEIDEYFADDRPNEDDYPDNYETYLEDLEDFEEFISAYKRSYDCHNGFNALSEDLDIIERFDPEWWDHAEFGRVIHTRVYCWFVGIQMAYEQLIRRGVINAGV